MERQNKTIDSEKILAAVGSVVTEFNNLEGTVGLWTSVLVNPRIRYDIVAAAAVGQLQFRRKVEMFEAAYRQRFPKGAPFGELRGLTKRLLAAGEERNRLVHGVWGETDQPDIAFYIRIKPSPSGILLDPFDWSSAQIQESAEKMNALVWEFAEFASLTIGVSAFNDVDWTGTPEPR